MSTIDLTPEHLTRAASDASSAAGEIRTAQQAGDAALADNAFGLMCTPFMLPAYLMVQTAADLLMGSAADSLDRAAGELRVSAAQFQLADSSVASYISQSQVAG